jgi:hypothetical protein
MGSLFRGVHQLALIQRECYQRDNKSNSSLRMCQLNAMQFKRLEMCCLTSMDMP